MNNVSDKPLHQQIIRPQRPDLPDSELNPRFTFERFVIGNEQPIAYPAAVAVSERPGMAYNPLLIYGGSGLGKTHLLHSIAHVCQNNGLRAIYISSEAFTNDLIDAIRTRTTPMFREKYRSADVLLVDDIQFIVGKESTQEEFFHTFNTLHMYGKQVVIASDRHPKDIVGIADRLRSRFLSGLMVDVQMPTLETRIAILQMWAKERGVVLPLSVAEMLANRARHNVRELESVFNQVAANAELGGQPLSLELAEAVQEGFHRPREHNITVAHVMNVTAKWHDLNVSDLIGPRRTGAVSQARQIAMYLAREMTTSSLPQIGKEFGGRRHSTVLHSCNKVSDDLVKDDLLRQAVKDIRDLLTKGG